MSETCFDECVDISIALSLVSEGNVLKKLKIFTVVVNARYVLEGLLVKSAPFFCQICTFFSCPKVVKSAPFFSLMFKGFFL